MPSSARYDSVAIGLHWLSAFAVLCAISIGLVMTDLDKGSSLRFSLFQWHKSVGITILALTVLRVGWRLGHQPPPLPETMPDWERLASRLGHLGLYALLVGMPLLGWAAVSASTLNFPTMIYGLWELPHLPILGTLPNKKAVGEVLEDLHSAGAWGMIALLVVHVGAALRHHWLLRDDVLRRMTPRTLIGS